MKQRKRRLSVIGLLTVLLTILLSGCAKEDKPQPQASSATAVATLTLMTQEPTAMPVPEATLVLLRPDATAVPLPGAQ